MRTTSWPISSNEARTGALGAAGSLSANSNAFQDVGLFPATTYLYQVYAIGSYGPSDYSNLAVVTTQLQPALPPAPLAVIPTAFNEITIRPARQLDGRDWLSDRAQPRRRELDHGGHYAAQRHYVHRFRGKRLDGVHVSRDRLEVRHLVALQPELVYDDAAVPPVAPTALKATPIAYNKISLTWQDNATNETAYKVQRSLDGTTWTTVATLAATRRRTPKRLDRFEVIPVSGDGFQHDGCVGQLECVAGTDLRTAAERTDRLEGGSSGSSMLLSWTDTSKNETGFKVLVRPTAFTGRSSADRGQCQELQSDCAAPKGQTYYYAVAATNQGGDSPLSLPVTLKYNTTSAKAAGCRNCDARRGVYCSPIASSSTSSAT